MNRTRTPILIAAFGAVAVLTTFVAVAWACTPSAYIDIDPGSGPAGTTVTVTGEGFTAQPVEIRWSKGGVDGGALATTDPGPNFSTTVTIPDASPGVYHVRAIGRDENGTELGTAVRAFEVTATPPPSTPAAGQPGTTAAPPPAPAPAPAPAVAPAPAPAVEPSGESPAASRPDRSPARSETSPARSETSGGRQPASRDTSDGRSREAAPPSRDTTPGVSTRSGARVFEDSVAPATATPSERSGRGTPQASRSGGGPSEGSAVGVWSGFSDGAPRATLPALSSPTPTRGSEFMPGLALLGIGLVTLAGGLGLGAMRRRRAAASQQR